MRPNGSLFIEDAYAIQYQIDWSTANGIVDITTIVREILEDEPNGVMLLGRAVYRKGRITTQRQLIRPEATGYTILADGAAQHIDFFQTTFPCGGGPDDTALYHLDHYWTDGAEGEVTIGSCWCDVDGTDEVVWGMVQEDGTVEDGTGSTLLEFIDTWS